LKSFRQQAAAEACRNDGLTDEQHKSMVDEFDRRIADFKSKWLVCRNRRCRRSAGLSRSALRMQRQQFAALDHPALSAAQAVTSVRDPPRV